MRARDYRLAGRAALSGNWFRAVIAAFIYSIISGIGSITYRFDTGTNTETPATESIKAITTSAENGGSGNPMMALVAALFIAGAMYAFILIFSLVVNSAVSIGYSKFNLDMVDGDKPRVRSLFAHFNQVATAIGAYILVFFRVLIGLCLFIVPGVIAAYKYSMVYYVMAEHPEYKARQVLRESARIMKGNKWKFFCLSLSFIGWNLLAAVTVIGIWFVIPYQQATCAAFYRDAKRRSYLY